nr:hypothetical protein [Tanacetum cinerariifolium]
MKKTENALNERPQGALPSNTIPNPKEDIKVITIRSGITLARPSVSPPNLLSSSKEVERDQELTMDQVHNSSSESTARVPSLIIQPTLISKSNEIPEPNPHQPPIPYPFRLNKDKLQDKSDIQIYKFLQMFKNLHFNMSFAGALTQLPKYAKMLIDLLTNKEKILELANTPLNENCSVVLLNKLPEQLGDPRKFLIPCDYKLANRSVAYPVGIAEDVIVQVGRPFLRTVRALVDVHGEKLTLRVGDEKLMFNVEITLKYHHKHGDDPTLSSDPVVVSLSQSLTPFRDSDFLLKETNAFLGLDDSIPPEIDN